MIEHVFVIGFHHHDLSSEERGEILRQETSSSFELDQNQIAKYDVKAATLLKTCNRLELYGYGNAEGAMALFDSIMDLDKSIKARKLFKLGAEAIHHIFKVVSGLDSQVIGDQEIMSQFKKSFQEAKNNQTIDGFMERLSNTSLQAAKKIRKKTNLSNGTTSLSYAAIKILKDKDIKSEASILVLGLGKFGKSIAQNIRGYFPLNTLTLCNRTTSKSSDLAQLIEANVLEFEQLKREISSFDVLICSIELQNYLLYKEDYVQCKGQIIIDLSVPSPIHPKVRELQSIEYFSFDDAADIVNKTIKNRQSSIEPAMEIIQEFADSFIEWGKTNMHVGAIKEWKKKISQAAEVCPFFQHLDENEKKYYLQRSIGHFANFVKKENPIAKEVNLIHQYLKPQA